MHMEKHAGLYVNLL